MLITNLNTLQSYKNALKSEVALPLELWHKRVLISPLLRLGKSLNEIRQEIKEAETLRLKKWSEEREKKLQEEEAVATAAEGTSSGASTSRPTPIQKKINRKDNSPVKVAEMPASLESMLIAS